MRIQRSRNQKVRNGNTKTDFYPQRWQAAETRRHDAVAEVDVAHYGEGDVEGCGEDLEGVGGFHGVLWALHFGDEDEEHEVAGVGEDRVGYCCEGIVECGGFGDFPGSGDDGLDAGDLVQSVSCRPTSTA